MRSWSGASGGGSTSPMRRTDSSPNRSKTTARMVVYLRPSMSENAIVCRELKKYYADVKAVDGLDLSVVKGECFGLLGPNGAGKTTTIEILEGLTPADSGDVQILGLNWRRNEIGRAHA